MFWNALILIKDRMEHATLQLLSAVITQKLFIKCLQYFDNVRCQALPW